MKKLVLEVLTTKWGKLVRVKEQTHRGDEFGIKTEIFIASTYFEIMSGDYPDIKNGRFCVRGLDSSLDNEILAIPSEEYLAKLRVAVREYNEFFSDKRKAPLVDGDVEVIE